MVGFCGRLADIICSNGRHAKVTVISYFSDLRAYLVSVIVTAWDAKTMSISSCKKAVPGPLKLDSSTDIFTGFAGSK